MFVYNCFDSPPNLAYYLGMTEPCNRLLKARVMAGYRSGRAAAAAMGMSPATYASHENGSRTFGVPEAHKYADIFNVSPGWLLTGEALNQSDFRDSRVQSKPGAAPQSKQNTIDVYQFGKKILELVTELAPHTEFASQPQSRTLGEVVIERLLNDEFDPNAEQWRIISQWQIPTAFIEDELGIPANDDPALIAVVDDNMAPTYNVGDRLIVNFTTKDLTGDGVYIFIDPEYGMHLQRLTVDGENVQVSNDNPTESTRHPAQVVALDALEIVGKVKGSVLVG